MTLIDTEFNRFSVRNELLSEGAEVQILLATGFKAFENVSWIS